jgi:hypothetical protein
MDTSSDIWDKELDELIRAWHEGDSEIPLVEFLGVSKTDYAAWVECRLSAAELLSRRNGKS